MKSKVLFLLTLVIGNLLVSCSKDDPKEGHDTDIGEQSVVTLTIYDATARTRAPIPGDEDDPASTTESAVNTTHGIKVVVFNPNGTLAYPTTSSNLTLTLTETAPNSGIYQTGEFTVTTGEKYFYIFANDPTSSTVIPNPYPNMSRDQFIRQTTTASLDATDVLNLTDPQFLMGSLWSEKIVAPGGGVPGDPVSMTLTIGRLVSKVTLNDVSKGASSNVQGTFTTPTYRLGTIPKIIFIAGNNDENSVPPPAPGHGIVTSAVHNAPVFTGPGDPNFLQYTNTWKNVDNSTPKSFYAVENTTAPDDSGIQYYGNTSYIQIRTLYTPDVSEVYNVDLTPKGTFTGPTFYTAKLISSGTRLIFEDDPREAAGNNPDDDIDQNSIQVYTNGLNYHKFPIHDPETGLPDVQKNAVLRNHSYIYTVTSIADIGSPDENVPPTEPIENETTLEIEVRIAPWSKIENNNVPI